MSDLAVLCTRAGRKYAFGPFPRTADAEVFRLDAAAAGFRVTDVIPAGLIDAARLNHPIAADQHQYLIEAPAPGPPAADPAVPGSDEADRNEWFWRTS
jgi:hypothetical protein